MPIAHSTRAPNEHLVFVKNVPGYLAKDTIPKLFVQYNPTGVKNVYPQSNITTVVVSFATRREAARAQQETDQMRLDNVILRVEGYNKTQSVRYLRDSGQASRPLGAVEDDNTEYSDEDYAQEPPAYTLQQGPIAAKDPNVAPQGITWAHIARNQRGATQPAVPTIQEADEEQDEVTPPKTPTVTPRMAVAVPNVTGKSKLGAADGFPPLMAQNPLPPTPPTLTRSDRTPTLPALADLLHNSVSAPSTSRKGNWTAQVPHEALQALWSRSDRTVMPAPHLVFNGARDDDDLEEKMKMQDISDWARKSTGMQVQAVSAWDPIDTTDRIRQRHCRGCAFCKTMLEFSC